MCQVERELFEHIKAQEDEIIIMSRFFSSVGYDNSELLPALVLSPMAGRYGCMVQNVWHGGMELTYGAVLNECNDSPFCYQGCCVTENR